MPLRRSIVQRTRLCADSQRLNSEVSLNHLCVAASLAAGCRVKVLSLDIRLLALCVFLGGFQIISSVGHVRCCPLVSISCTRPRAVAIHRPDGLDVSIECARALVENVSFDDHVHGSARPCRWSARDAASQRVRDEQRCADQQVKRLTAIMRRSPAFLGHATVRGVSDLWYV